MKTFPVTSIATSADGECILNGPKGSISVRRLHDRCSNANRYTMMHATESPTYHVCEVSELTIKRGGWFTNLAF